MKQRIVLAVLVSTLCFGISAYASQVHNYDLNGSLTDSLGGPSLVNNGGTLGASGITFGANQGPSLSNGINASTYSIEMQLSLDDTSGWRKLIDFKDLGVDTGMYLLNGTQDFYDVGTGLGGIGNGTTFEMALTRDGVTNQVKVYLNGALSLTFTDSGNLATFTGPSNIIHFMRDDISTSQTEASGGFVDRIRIFDHVLSDAEALSMSDGTYVPPVNSVPEPGSVTLLGLGLAGLVGAVRRIKS